MATITLSLDDVQKICPDCATLMVQKGLHEVALDDLPVVKAKKKGGMDTSDPGLFTRCLDTAGAKNASDPNAYCAAVHQKITGHWPAQDKAKKKSATAVDVLSEIVKEVK